MLRLAAVVSIVMLAACNGGKSAPAGGGSQGSGSAVAVPALVVTDQASAEAADGKQAEVRGTAEDAKLGAEVTVGRMPIYCAGLDRWPAEVAGKAVVARGLLEREPPEEVDPALPSAGASGGRWVLRSCTYEAAP